MTSTKPVIIPSTLATMTYTNWKGKVSQRIIQPISIRHGSTQWHPVPCLLLLAFDVEKGAEREFSLQDCDFTTLFGETS